jgi:hypothetical protein
MILFQPLPPLMQASQIGLVDGGIYPVALFHALRHPPKSHLVFYTTVNTLTSAVVPGETCPTAVAASSTQSVLSGVRKRRRSVLSGLRMRTLGPMWRP